METLGWVVVAAVLVYIAVCFGKIAGNHGKNPFLYGLLSVISPVNLVMLGYWAFSRRGCSPVSDKGSVGQGVKQ